MATGPVARSALSLLEVAANSTSGKSAGSATTNSPPKNLASKSRSMVLPCCTKVGTDAIKSLHQKLSEQKESLQGCKALELTEGCNSHTFVGDLGIRCESRWLDCCRKRCRRSGRGRM